MYKSHLGLSLKEDPNVQLAWRKFFHLSTYSIRNAPVLVLIGALKSFKGKRMIQLFLILLFAIFEIAVLYMVLFVLLFGRNS